MGRTENSGTNRSNLPDVLQFMQVLWGLSHGLERLSKRMATTLGITGPQRLTLRVIGLFPGISAGELAGVMHIHPSTLTGILQRLVQRGLVRRTSGRGDRRLAVLRLTSRGRAQNRNRRGTLEAAVTRALRESSSAERLAATRLLARVTAFLDPGGGSTRAGATGAGLRRAAGSR
jgi:DNA-binding MarR family transcriptional regulator